MTLVQLGMTAEEGLFSLDLRYRKLLYYKKCKKQPLK